MPLITVYKIGYGNAFDGDVEIEVTDPVTSPIPAGHTRVSPHPIPSNHYALMNGGWVYVQGEAPTPPPLNYSQQNKAQAEKLLQESDWTENPSARNTAKTPHLVNGDAFDDYRVALRAIAVNPPETQVTDWPVEPDEVWS